MRLPWPLPALLAWVSAWAVFWLGAAFGLPLIVAALCAACTSLLWAWGVRGWWRQALLVLGFPLSLALGSGVLGLPPGWVWLLGAVLLLLLYPLQAWRDAPLFPTPIGALSELAGVAPLPAGARVLDAGCGSGAGLRALRLAYPHAELHGIERSWPLRWWCGWRCPWARVRQGDIWAADWSGYDMVYLFQRPESMPRALQQARAQLKAGAWLVSLEFEAAQCKPKAVLPTQQGRRVWVYQMTGNGGKP